MAEEGQIRGNRKVREEMRWIKTSAAKVKKKMRMSPHSSSDKGRNNRKTTWRKKNNISNHNKLKETKMNCKIVSLLVRQSSHRISITDPCRRRSHLFSSIQ